MAALFGIAWLSHAAAPPPGVVASPSPVCQTPYEPAADVWKPQSPLVLYSHIGLAEMPNAVLPGCRIGTQPPVVLSKFQGILSPVDGPDPANRMPRSRTPLGMMSVSETSRTPLLFRSSPRMLVTVGVPEMVVPGTNMDEKVTSSSGSTNSLNGSTTSGRSICRLRFRSRTSRPPAG